MSLECDRWADIADRLAIDEPLSEEEVALLASHPRECARCQHEASVWRAMGGVAERGALDAESLEEAADRILERHSVETQSSVPSAGPGVVRLRARPAPLVASTAILLALAACVTLLVRGRKQPGPAEAPAFARARVSVVSGYASLDGRPARAGDAFLPGQTLQTRGFVCLDVEKDVQACLEPGSEARLEDAALAHRVVELRRGRLWASLGHQPAGTSFSVSTARGEVTAVGTSFLVDVAAGSGQVVVRVKSGVVSVQAPGVPSLQVEAGRESVLGTSVVQRSAADEPGPARERPPSTRLWNDEELGFIDVHTDPAGAAIDVDGASGGASPLSLCLPVGDHSLLVHWPGGALSREEVHVSHRDRVRRDLTRPSALVPTPIVPAPSAPPSDRLGLKDPPPATASYVPSADELLQRARGLRGEGRFAEAAAAYQRLEELRPGSPEALASLVSLGDLELSHLGDAASALAAFDSYLASSGALAEEALYGRIGALSALHREDEARRAIDTFLLQYPSSVHADALRQRRGDASTGLAQPQ